MRHVVAISAVRTVAGSATSSRVVAAVTIRTNAVSRTRAAITIVATIAIARPRIYRRILMRPHNSVDRAALGCPHPLPLYPLRPPTPLPLCVHKTITTTRSINGTIPVRRLRAMLMPPI